MLRPSAFQNFILILKYIKTNKMYLNQFDSNVLKSIHVFKIRTGSCVREMQLEDTF